MILKFKTIIVLMVGILATLLSAHTACAASKSPPTPNQFLQGGEPTFIVGTAGDHASDLKILAEARFIRDTLFPNGSIILDTEIDLTKGSEAWPQRPVLYGGAHVNRVIAALQDELPFAITQGRMHLGNVSLQGTGYGLITVVPGQRSTGSRLGHPDFLLYAGTSTPGVAGINAVWHGNEQILVTDKFGRYLSGAWQPQHGGEFMPYFPPQQPYRIEWRTVIKTLGTENGGNARIHVHFPKMLPATATESDEVKAIIRGAKLAIEKIALPSPLPVNVYVYPDRRSKEAITNNNGDGHAVVHAQTLHIIRFDAAQDGPLQNLSAHELTHIYAYQKAGAPGSSLMGEGLAVWVAGSYGGTSLNSHKASLPAPPISSLIGRGFFTLPESQSYPLAGIFVQAAIETVGLEKFLAYLYPATTQNWRDSCLKAGTSPAALQQAFARKFSQ